MSKLARIRAAFTLFAVCVCALAFVACGDDDDSGDGGDGGDGGGRGWRPTTSACTGSTRRSG